MSKFWGIPPYPAFMTMGVVEFFLKELQCRRKVSPQCNVLLSGNIVVVIGRSVVRKNIDVKPWTSSFSVNWGNSSIIVFERTSLIQ